MFRATKTASLPRLPETLLRAAASRSVPDRIRRPQVSCALSLATSRLRALSSSPLRFRGQRISWQSRNALTVVNFNFMDFVVPFDACTFYTPFLKQAYFHMSIVPLCATVIAIAGLLVCGCRNQNHWGIVRQRAKSVLVTLVFLLCE